MDKSLPRTQAQTHNCERLRQLLASFGADKQCWPSVERESWSLLAEVNHNAHDLTKLSDDELKLYQDHQQAKMTDDFCSQLFSHHAEPDFVRQAVIPACLLHDEADEALLHPSPKNGHESSLISKLWNWLGLEISLPQRAAPKMIALAFSFTLIAGGLTGGLDQVYPFVDETVASSPNSQVSDNKDGWSLLLLGPETEALWRL